jgi:hypothetical protein
MTENLEESDDSLIEALPGIFLERSEKKNLSG